MESEFGRLLNALPGLVWTTKADGTPDFVNKAWRDYTGLGLDAVGSSEWTATFHPDDLAVALDSWNSALEGQGAHHVEVRLRRFDGAYRRFSIEARPRHDAAGELVGWCGINTDIEDQKRAEAQLAAEKQLFEQIARGTPLSPFLEDLCVQVEQLSPGSLCSILFIDDDGKHFSVGAGPSLPRDYNSALEGLKIDANFGPCSRAVETRSTIIVVDPPSDPRWGPVWPSLMVEHGLASCWSAPIFGSSDKVLGIFAIYRREAEGPTAEEQEHIDRFAKIAGIAIERAQSYTALNAGETDLRRANHFLNGAQRLSKTGSFSLDTLTDEQIWSEENYRIWEYDPTVPPNMDMVAATIHPEDREATLGIFADATAAKQDFEVFYRIVTPIGGVKHLHTVMEIIPEFTDRIVYLGSSQDVTATKLAEEALRASEAGLRRANQYLAGAQKLSKTGSFTWNVDTDEQDWSEELYRIWEIDPADPHPVPWLHAAVLHPDDVDAVEAIQAPAFAAGEGFEVSYRIITRSGAIKHLHTVNQRVAEIPDQLVYIGATQDLTESRLAEQALKASEARLQRAHDHLAQAQQLSHTGSFTTDFETDTHIWSDELYRILEFEIGTPVSFKDFRALIHPDDQALFSAGFLPTIKDGTDFDQVFRLTTPNGTAKYLHAVAKRLEGPPAAVFMGSIQDVTETKLAETELARANTYLVAAQRLSQTGSFTWDVAADDHNWSEVIYRVFGFEPGTKVTMDMMMPAIHPEDLAQVEALITGAQMGENFDLTFRIIRPGGDIRHAQVVGHRIDNIPDRPVFMGALQDITERKVAEDDLNRARAQLAHVARVTALSALTASIAHEVNQPLAGIITNASTCLRMLATDPPDIEGARATAQRTIRDGNRASDVIKRLRALFARKEPNLEPIDLNDAAREVLALSTSELQHRRVVVRADLADSLPPVSGDKVQLQQVILNLVLNAADAMDGVEDRSRELRLATGQGPDGSATLRVQDVGVGFDAEAAERLFDAFHTTKPDGMGIGLSISRSIIESHGGRIEAAPNTGAPGATFSFSIPCATPPAAELELRNA